MSHLSANPTSIREELIQFTGLHQGQQEPAQAFSMRLYNACKDRDCSSLSGAARSWLAMGVQIARMSQH